MSLPFGVLIRELLADLLLIRELLAHLLKKELRVGIHGAQLFLQPCEVGIGRRLQARDSRITSYSQSRSEPSQPRRIALTESATETPIGSEGRITREDDVSRADASRSSR